ERESKYRRIRKAVRDDRDLYFLGDLRRRTGRIIDHAADQRRQTDHQKIYHHVPYALDDFELDTRDRKTRRERAARDNAGRHAEKWAARLKCDDRRGEGTA